MGVPLKGLPNRSFQPARHGSAQPTSIVGRKEVAMKSPCLRALASLLILSSCTNVQEGEGLALRPSDPVRLAIHQGRAAAIPGSGGQIKVRLGDITGGQVMLSVVKADGELLVEPYSVRPGEVIQAQLGDEELYIKVVELRNFLLGDDFGEFEVSKSPLDPGVTPSQDSQQGAPVDADKPRD